LNVKTLTTMVGVKRVFRGGRYCIISGPILCKVLLFISNSAACFVNWVWLVMFLQRCVVILFPLKRYSIYHCKYTTKNIFNTEIAVPFLCKTFHFAIWSEYDCFSDEGYKWVALFEALITYVCPFVCTMIADLIVLSCHNKSVQEWCCFDNIFLTSKLVLWAFLFFLVYLQNFQVTNFRRQRAIRRCLFMATVQMILNAPYYTLQLIDEYEPIVMFLYICTSCSSRSLSTDRNYPPRCSLFSVIRSLFVPEYVLELFSCVLCKDDFHFSKAC
uniref:G_PROTEIN_RECEP_F1_2 domain-containing protein n=1 Tax=Angiostrongylus cantonensis TaxID=6313 RepID=A0A0K0DM35_ANGCA